jgi:hypothetical protein
MNFESVRNYYEHLVYAEVKRRFENEKGDVVPYEDVACIALNHLPPRYFRHEVDFAFYLSPIERQEIYDKVTNAVDLAISKVNKKT